MSQIEAVEGKVRAIRRKTRRKYSAEERIRIVLERLRSEDSTAELCHREGDSPQFVLQMEQGASGGGQTADDGRRSGSVIRFSQAEKLEIIRLVEGSSLPVKHTLSEMDLTYSSYYIYLIALKRRSSLLL